jgi:hypothetical protein
VGSGVVVRYLRNGSPVPQLAFAGVGVGPRAGLRSEVGETFGRINGQKSTRAQFFLRNDTGFDNRDGA